MPIITIVFGILLIGLGLLGYFGAAGESPSPTTLIPVPFGVLLLLCGLIALKSSLLKHAMHAAAVVGLLGFVLAGGRAGMKLAKGTLDLSARPDMMVSAMAVLCLVFVGLCVMSFVSARRRRQAVV